MLGHTVAICIGGMYVIHVQYTSLLQYSAELVTSSDIEKS